MLSDVKARIEANRARRNTRSISFTRHHSPGSESHPSYHYSTPSSTTPSSCTSSAAASFYQSLFDTSGPIEKELNLTPDELTVAMRSTRGHNTNTNNHSETLHPITRPFWNQKVEAPDEEQHQEPFFPLRPRRATVSLSAAEAAKHRQLLAERRASKSETSQAPAPGRMRRPRSGTTSLIPSTAKQVSVPLSALQFAARKKENAHSIWSNPQEEEDEDPEKEETSIYFRDGSQQLRVDRASMAQPQVEIRKETEQVICQLRHVFKDIFDPSIRDYDLMDMLRTRFDMQENRIQQLEHVLRQKEDQIQLLEARQASPCGKLPDVLEEEEEEEDEEEILEENEEEEVQERERSVEEREEEEQQEEETVSIETMGVDDLLQRCPESMAVFRQQIEGEVYARLFQEFEAQKQILVAQQQESFEALKLKYRAGFERIIDRLMRDSSRVHNERSKRAHKDTEDRERCWSTQMEELKRSLYHLE
ncbi:hypothetical protein EC973_004210 [Apophysomyces ossiformis]|uniref:Uncharacterized protein n=1 Tax=Apophysomyces ossiformis TaxID=679940 RepID=A0A8H7ETB1_9FUNG|nr:hypothetical protein EC973_004210 [Apophysomyces ossiformis]